MNHVTDTYIDADHFCRPAYPYSMSPDHRDGELVAFRVRDNNVERAHLQLNEWVRQLEELMRVKGIATMSLPDATLRLSRFDIDNLLSVLDKYTQENVLTATMLDWVDKMIVNLIDAKQEGR